MFSVVLVYVGIAYYNTKFFINLLFGLAFCRSCSNIGDVEIIPFSNFYIQTNMTLWNIF